MFICQTELSFVQLIRILHPNSSTITANVLWLYFNIIKYAFECSKINEKEIINNKSLVIIEDYLINLKKLG